MEKASVQRRAKNERGWGGGMYSFVVSLVGGGRATSKKKKRVLLSEVLTHGEKNIMEKQMSDTTFITCFTATTALVLSTIPGT